MEKAVETILLLIMIVLLALIWPVASFVLGAFVGWVASAVFPFFGQWIIDGLALFGLHIAMTQLPLLTATLGFVGGFFKSRNSSTSKK